MDIFKNSLIKVMEIKLDMRGIRTFAAIILLRHESFVNAVVDHYFGKDDGSLSTALANILAKAGHD